ncbi:alpha/beta fold hydrolase [Psychrobium sp. 1_MG-2023]|uniref:alpha/beta fold hydrolase n=1 Tax=Psychrobium sp. 1_MG-2023 TaxID=3062624 RepID=UPI000C33E4C4|nr:alpha/beta hydrolase [Psychrobium sp. 1_MG-2023]MDP2561523.1 alpha/beta hydrolase [Psychrobium sp. 1_MG-2023]PKF54987.1 hypothetical protein CW748_14500 [Alteromonadales bacterium alter-6D02]
MRKKLFFIPGTMCTDKLWTEVLPHLAKDFEPVLLNIPQGKSFDELAAYYDNLFGDKPVHVIGFSLGGYIAAYYAMRYPHNVAKLFVISNSPTALPTLEYTQRSKVLEFAKIHGYKGISRKKAAGLLDRGVLSDSVVDLIIEMDKESGEEQFFSQYQCTLEREDLRVAISDFPFPTHFYYSEDDAVVNSQWLSNLEGLNMRLSLYSTAGSGHMLPLEKPHELATQINRWAQ